MAKNWVIFYLQRTAASRNICKSLKGLLFDLPCISSSSGCCSLLKLLTLSNFAYFVIFGKHLYVIFPTACIDGEVYFLTLMTHECKII